MSVNQFKIKFIKVLYDLKKAAILFQNKKVSLAAAASSFYLILAVIPLTVLISRLVGLFFEDYVGVYDLFKLVASATFPDFQGGLATHLNNFIKGPLYNSRNFTFFNFVILTLSSLSFFNTIWNALYLMSEKKTYITYTRHFKALGLIGVTCLGLLFTLSLYPILAFIVSLMTDNFIVNTIYDNYFGLRGFIDFFRELPIETLSFFGSTGFRFCLFVIFSSLIFRILLNWRISFLSSLGSSGLFSVLVLIGKSLFVIYIENVRENAISFYGDFYTVLMLLSYIFLIMCCFFYCLCLSLVIRERQKVKKSEEFENLVES